MKKLGLGAFLVLIGCARAQVSLPYPTTALGSPDGTQAGAIFFQGPSGSDTLTINGANPYIDCFGCGTQMTIRGSNTTDGRIILSPGAVSGLNYTSFQGNAFPSNNDTYNLGQSGQEWLNVFGKTITTNSIQPEGSAPSVGGSSTPFTNGNITNLETGFLQITNGSTLVMTLTYDTVTTGATFLNPSASATFEFPQSGGGISDGPLVPGGNNLFNLGGPSNYWANGYIYDLTVNSCTGCGGGTNYWSLSGSNITPVGSYNLTKNIGSGSIGVSGSPWTGVYAINYYVGTGTPSTGATCSGTPTSSFASIGGLVTHC